MEIFVDYRCQENDQQLLGDFHHSNFDQVPGSHYSPLVNHYIYIIYILRLIDQPSQSFTILHPQFIRGIPRVFLTTTGEACDRRLRPAHPCRHSPPRVRELPQGSFHPRMGTTGDYQQGCHHPSLPL